MSSGQVTGRTNPEVAKQGGKEVGANKVTRKRMRQMRGKAWRETRGAGPERRKFLLRRGIANPTPRFFVSVAFKGVSLAVRLLFATLDERVAGWDGVVLKELAGLPGNLQKCGLRKAV